MIEFYRQSTPNGRKVSIMLEETGLEYQVRVVDILEGDQFQTAFRRINPNAKIPAIVDTNGPDGASHTVFESGAILTYLAEKAGSKFSASDPLQRSTVLQWLMFQMASIGPLFGQYHHFVSFAPEKVPYAIVRYRKEVQRLYAVMDERLSAVTYFAGDRYSIADIAVFPWVARFEAPEIDISIDSRRHLKRWYDVIAARPAVKRGMVIP